MTDEMNADERTVKVRDFVGHDFTSWVYDLHRPDEPYAARGAHPSGVGYDRYRGPDDLTAGEKRYLDHMGRLQLLNFLDPNLVGWRGVGVSASGARRTVLAGFTSPISAATNAEHVG